VNAKEESAHTLAAIQEDTRYIPATMGTANHLGILYRMADHQIVTQGTSEIPATLVIPKTAILETFEKGIQEMRNGVVQAPTLAIEHPWITSDIPIIPQARLIRPMVTLIKGPRGPHLIDTHHPHIRQPRICHLDQHHTSPQIERV
jgi:hypothetical protein